MGDGDGGLARVGPGGKSVLARGLLRWMMAVVCVMGGRRVPG